MYAPTSKPSCNQTDGFALIASLSIMAILVLIAVALYSMSAVATRSANIAAARIEAQANAKVALMQAIGELQKQMGPDQRISANASILDTSPDSAEVDGVANPQWLGIWDSWIAGPIPDTVADPSVHTPSHHQTIGDQPEDSMRPEYDRKNDYFRRWLVSLTDPINRQDPEIPKFPLIGDVMPQRASTAVRLVGQASLSPTDPNATIKPTDLVSAQLVEIDGDGTTPPRGRIAWWVGDESQKAMIMENTHLAAGRSGSLADKLFRQQAPASLGNAAIPGLENIGDQSALASIPSRDTLPLVGGTTPQVGEQFHHVTTASYGVLADVREGGLKRDLSTLLERTIDPEEVYELTGVADFERADSLTKDGADFMLYNFDDLLNSSVGNTGEAAVPIQDLAVYHQLYNRYRPDSKGGIQYSSSETSPPNDLLQNGIMVSNPDYGETSNDYDKYLRQNTALYRNPAVVKIEIILSYVCELIIPIPTDPDADTHRLRVGISPAMTFWNPNNVPMVMRIDDPEKTSLMIREYPIGINLNFKKSPGPTAPAIEEIDKEFGKITYTKDELYSLFVFGNYPTVFEPGESKVFALRFASLTDQDSATNYTDFTLRGTGYRYNEPFVPELELVQGWNPERFIRPTQKDSDGTEETIFTFKQGDYISASITAGSGNTFNIDFAPKARHGRNAPGVQWHYRAGLIRGPLNADSSDKENFVYSGFPLDGASGISNTSPRSMEVSARSAQTLIDSMGNPFDPTDDLPQPFFYYSIKAGTETHESNNVAGASEGSSRRFPTRPFTHSTPIAPVFIDNLDAASLYNYGWNWFFMPLDNMFDAPIEISGSNSGYYGGGYTAENGVTNIVQQQLPLTPPISIATLSHARLGGFSLGTEAPADGYSGLGDSNSERFRRTTAIGFGGLAPHTLQAIGNSYAHPNIPPGQAVTTWQREFQNGNRVKEPFADHSYLANKALWDDYFFSSISPKPGESGAFPEDKTVEEVANEFFFEQQALPNPRIVPDFAGINQTRLDSLFVDYDQFKGGFADKIATHLLVEGPFNVNSTSVTAWKALFSSLKGQSISYFDAESALVVGTNLDFDNTEGVPIPGGPLPNGKAYEGSSTDPSDPEQWTGFRELTEIEIEELANAMVAQVKLRGPFLSLSEFINRRLDTNNADDMALKGALQAAIDDPAVSINGGFINNSLREFTSTETTFMSGVAFPKALEGPIAYGSAAYVDQADLLKNFPAQLTPRGDTFVIRAYGDALDGPGQNVQARAWCEAVVQRVTEYVDPSSDEAYEKQSALVSEANKNFGRQFRVVSFRWLSASEI